MKITLKVQGLEELKENMARIPPEIHRETGSLLRQQARATAVQLARVTPPFGFLPPLKARAAIRNGVRRVFTSVDHPSRVYDLIKRQSPQDAAIFWRYHTARNTTGMRKIALKYGVSYGVDLAVLKRARTGSKGEVPKDQQPLRLGPETKIDRLSITQAQRSGLAKAGWVRAALALGGRIRRGGGADGGTSELIPAWLRSLARDPELGTSTFGITADKSTVTLHNRVRYASEAIDQGQIAMALDDARIRFVKTLARSVKALARKTLKKAA